MVWNQNSSDCNRLYAPQPASEVSHHCYYYHSLSLQLQSLLLHYYYITITLLLHYYYITLHWVTLHYITLGYITLLLHYYYIIITITNHYYYNHSLSIMHILVIHHAWIRILLSDVCSLLHYQSPWSSEQLNIKMMATVST